LASHLLVQRQHSVPHGFEFQNVFDAPAVADYVILFGHLRFQFVYGG
jgi:hypothetical protein